MREGTFVTKKEPKIGYKHKLVIANFRCKIIPNITRIEFVRDEEGNVVAHHQLDGFAQGRTSRKVDEIL